MAGTVEAYDTSKGTRYRVRYRKPDGAQTDKRGFSTKRDARLFLSTVDVTKARGEYIDPTDGRRLVSDMQPTWERARLGTLKPSSRAAMLTAWRIHVQPEWGARKVGTIRKTEVSAWIGEMTSRKSAQTVRRAVFVLSGILDVAVEDRAIGTNPAKGVDLPAKRRKEATYLSHKQVSALVSEAKYPELVEFLAYTGVRWGEAAALRIRNLDLPRHRALISENAVIVKGVYEVGTPKSGKNRTIVFPEFLVPGLRKLVEGRDGSHRVFGDAQPPRYPHATSGWLVSAVSSCQFDDPSFPTITLHDLRHTAASLAISAGANVKAVQRMLGHASAAMTLDVYADLFDEDLGHVAEALARAREAALE
ncbi:site-specific integrase [Microbacterium sp. K24]|uniref:tyrosine-type recombinase/integrase n=1 Tax=Microbacterium sp. K24 TaxID=2305446 RepID=UPI00109D586A|nr:site-specific integrase [Microbacterium sp. K24]